MNWNVILEIGFTLPNYQIRAPDKEEICCCESLLEVLASIFSYYFNIFSYRRKYLFSYCHSGVLISRSEVPSITFWNLTKQTLCFKVELGGASIKFQKYLSRIILWQKHWFFIFSSVFLTYNPLLSFIRIFLGIIFISDRNVERA